MKSSAMACEAMGGGDYLQEWHDRHPGATSTMLVSLTDDVGRNSYEVLAEVIQDGDEPVLDLACGEISGRPWPPVRLGGGGWTAYRGHY